MKKRNPNATCGTCPYWHRHPKSVCGDCRANPEVVEMLDTEWCGQHPDFWEEEITKQASPDYDPPTHDDVLAAYRTAVEMAQCCTGRICDRCANARTVACGRCLVGWKLQFQPKEDAQ